VLSGSIMLPGKIMLGGIYSFRSNLPFSVTTSTLTPAGGVFTVNPNPNGTAQYVPGTTRDQGNRNLNYAALNLYRSQIGLSSNLSAGSVASTKYNDFDIRVSKYFFQHETRRLEIIGQAFNLFGTENYTTITNSPISPTFGAPTAANTVQIGELAAKFTF
jgi:hypothetical protein